MNKTLFVLFGALFLMNGCTRNEFSLEVTLEDTTIFAGKTVYLTDLVNGNYVPFDSAVIHKEKFSISTVCDSSRIVFFTIPTSPYDAPTIIPVVFERGNVQLQITNNAFILSGTQQNVVLQQFAEVETNIWKKLENYKLQLQADSAITDSARILNADNAQMLANQEYGEKSFELVKQNANKAIGKYIFLQTYYYYKPDMIDEIVALMDDDVKADIIIQKIMTNNELTKSLGKGANYIDFKSITPTGDTLAFSDLIGKTDFVLLDFWASWCPDCVAEIPALKQIYEKNKERLEILSVSLDDDKEKWINGIKKFDLQWKQVSNLTEWNDHIAKSYAVNSIPCIYLIDRNGKIVAAKATLSEIREILLSVK